MSDKAKEVMDKFNQLADQADATLIAQQAAARKARKEGKS